MFTENYNISLRNTSRDPRVILYWFVLLAFADLTPWNKVPTPHISIHAMLFHGQAQSLATIVNQVVVLLENSKRKNTYILHFSMFLHDRKKNFMNELLTESYLCTTFFLFSHISQRPVFVFFFLLRLAVKVKPGHHGN